MSTLIPILNTLSGPFRRVNHLSRFEAMQPSTGVNSTLDLSRFLSRPSV